MIYSGYVPIGPQKLTEEALKATITNEIEAVRIICKQECSIAAFLELQAKLATIKTLCKFGNKQICSMSLRGGSQLRIYEKEIEHLARKANEKYSNNESAFISYLITLEDILI